MEEKTNITKSLSVLGLKPASKRVLMFLAEHNESSAADIAAILNLPKSSVYDALEELVQASIVTEYSNGKSKTFVISDEDQILRVHKTKMAELESAHKNLFEFIKDHGKKDIVGRPRIKFYAGVDGMKQALRDMSWDKKYKEAYLMWPTSNMIDVLGIDFMYEHRRPGIELGVAVKVIEPQKDRQLQVNGPEWLRNSPDKLNFKRFAPKNTEWNMSFWIYGEKCLFASAGSEKIAFVIHSKEFANLQKILWQQMWNISKE